MAQKINQLGRNFSGDMAEAHQFAYAQSRTNRPPVLGGVVQLDKHVAAKHGLDHVHDALVAQLFDLHRRQKAFETLVLQVF